MHQMNLHKPDRRGGHHNQGYHHGPSDPHRRPPDHRRPDDRRRGPSDGRCVHKTFHKALL